MLSSFTLYITNGRKEQIILPQIFTHKEKEELKRKMLDVGFELIKKYGMTHTSIEKVTQAVDIGRSTFYNFFPTKEKFVYDIIVNQRKKGKRIFTERLAGREKMTPQEGKEYFRYLLSGVDTIYQYLTADDELKLQSALPDEFEINLDDESKTLDGILGCMDGVKTNIDYETTANMMKVIALTQEAKDMLHKEAIESTLSILFDGLFSLIFEA